MRDEELELGLVGLVPAQRFEKGVGIGVAQIAALHVEVERDAQEGRREARVLQRIPDVEVDAVFVGDGRGRRRFADLRNARAANRLQAKIGQWIR